MNSFEICKALEVSGTGVKKLDVLESILKDHYLETGVLLPPKKMLEKFESHPMIDMWTGTAEKIKSLIEYGVITIPKTVEKSRFWELAHNAGAAAVNRVKEDVQYVKDFVGNAKKSVHDDFEKLKDAAFGVESAPVQNTPVSPDFVPPETDGMKTDPKKEPEKELVL